MARTRFLTPELIARKALEVGDRGGAEAMTMRRIAAELGCDPMALYRHFANREALLDAVADLAVAEVGDPGVRMPWDERISVTADAVREAALRHPGITAHLAARPPTGENGRRIARGLMEALGAAGLPSATAVRSFQTLTAYLASSLAMAVRAGARDRRWEHVRDVMDELPDVAAPGEELFAVGSAEQFRFGLRLLLAGIRAEAAAGR
ncbi:TetR/AcrR family transcriptional regulator C-terminal domain-containing protein [Streptomyces sp. JJ38]|uniref:TetR/AcrR family transcriptional regulator C-terminal domain-containing protein n=1 Tax=Streptomyces sp. JJ38 TaxID=2738128 RepID=UPI001C59EFCF|nr:TetR/AcrR family transcriptional regulator C-terminal domain-containing protein [Streptomyces sp. JJ38]MBW1596176.1 TetR family transcriptional regulator [Streptomyces sp. JJ38]